MVIIAAYLLFVHIIDGHECSNREQAVLMMHTTTWSWIQFDPLGCDYDFFIQHHLVVACALHTLRSYFYTRHAPVARNCTICSGCELHGRGPVD